MKNLFLVLTSLLFFRLQPSNGQDLVVNHPVQAMSVNNKEISAVKLLSDNLRVYISTKPAECQMQIFSDVNNTSSCGKISNVQFRRSINSGLVVHEYKFLWNFTNNYDNESGVAIVNYMEINNTNAKDIRITIESDKYKIFINTIVDYSWKPLNQKIDAKNGQNR